MAYSDYAYDDFLVVKINDDFCIYDSDFENAIAAACDRFQIEDLCKEGQQRWRAVLEYVGKRVFPDNKILRDRNLYSDSVIPTNHNKYNMDYMTALFNYYVYLSNRYNKLISITAYAYMVNVKFDVIDQWRNTEPSTLTYRIWKNAREGRLECILNHAYDNGNVTGVMFVGNYEYNMNMPGVRNESPRIGHADAQAIAARYGVEIEQKEGAENVQNQS